MKTVDVSVRLDKYEATLTLVDGDHMTKVMQASGMPYEYDLLEAVRELARPGTYVDVGAHAGNHSVFFAKACPSTLVKSFEPDEDNFNLLDRNLKPFVKAIPIRAAVHDVWSRVHVVHSGTNTGMHQVKNRGGILAMRLDDILFHDVQVALIKIDVEGLEVPVLRSAYETIRKHHPILIAEAWNMEAQSAIEATIESIALKAAYKRLPKQYGKTPTFIYVPRATP